MFWNFSFDKVDQAVGLAADFGLLTTTSGALLSRSPFCLCFHLSVQGCLADSAVWRCGFFLSSALLVFSSETLCVLMSWTGSSSAHLTSHLALLLKTPPDYASTGTENLLKFSHEWLCFCNLISFTFMITGVIMGKPDTSYEQEWTNILTVYWYPVDHRESYVLFVFFGLMIITCFYIVQHPLTIILCTIFLLLKFHVCC